MTKAQKALAKTLDVGDEVYWTDPGEDIASGYYWVTRIHKELKEKITDDTIVVIQNHYSEAEVYFKELS